MLSSQSAFGNRLASWRHRAMDLQLLPIFAPSSPPNCAFLPCFGDTSFLGWLSPPWCTERSRQLAAAPGAAAQSQRCSRALGGGTLHQLPPACGQSPRADLTHAHRQVTDRKPDKAMRPPEAGTSSEGTFSLSFKTSKIVPQTSPSQLRDPEDRPQLCCRT